ncbi:hypothetical protein EVAR_54089_1 [Eumeta japonica]|uniref:Uncharacterized protein n=1 Tax=Eumeta variegata TaxID=151549 RepID=A0A4C1XHU9_EUMVA|nr:hypothetical protein EVAR_54089_1 [Eumeta japonica]
MSKVVGVVRRSHIDPSDVNTSQVASQYSSRNVQVPFVPTATLFKFAPAYSNVLVLESCELLRPRARRASRRAAARRCVRYDP